MKNIHIIPTDKPSRLFDFMTALVLLKKASPNDSGTNQNIYITSNDEEIKEGDWYLVELFKITGESDGFHIEKCTKLDDVWCNNFDVISTRHKDNCKKIILTDNKDLIKDGVQSIDDEFLEWFVKNPSFEYVEAKSIKTIPALQLTGNNHCFYKILIPQEEPKQELERGITITHVGKQETLEEAAAKYVENELQDRGTFDDKVICSIDFIAGANWQADRMYSEEEVLDILFCMSVDNPNDITKWFEQFKKK
jgi:hypothetical protein